MSSRTSDLGTPSLQPLEVSGGKACCSIGRWALPATLLVAITAVVIAAFFAGRSSADRERVDAYAALLAQAGTQFPAVNATATATSEKFTIATGTVSQESEGFFVLDHNSGLLTCNVVYPRLGRFGAQYSTNVAEVLGTAGKGGQYIMVTGSVDFPSNNANPAGSCMVYVMDSATGNFAAYYVPFNRTMISSGRAQKGQLVLREKGTANPLIDRDNLR